MGILDKLGINNSQIKVIKNVPTSVSSIKCGHCGSQKITRSMNFIDDILTNIICMECGKTTSIKV